MLSPGMLYRADRFLYKSMQKYGGLHRDFGLRTPLCSTYTSKMGLKHIHVKQQMTFVGQSLSIEDWHYVLDTHQRWDKHIHVKQ